MTVAINRDLCRGAVTVADAEVRHAVRVACRDLKLVVEPGGAVALAAVLAGKVETQGRTSAVVLSGGNVDETLYAEILREADSD